MSPLELEEKIESLKTLLFDLQSPPEPVDEEERGLVRASNIVEPVNASEKIKN